MNQQSKMNSASLIDSAEGPVPMATKSALLLNNTDGKNLSQKNHPKTISLMMIIHPNLVVH